MNNGILKMSTIFDLHISITNMSPQDALKRIMELRKSRLVPKKTRRIVKRSAASKTPKDPLKAVDKAELIRLLEESLK